jgi:predicted RND superfamily exporter protein
VGRHPRRVLVAAGLLMAVAVTLASRLELRTAFSELLPSDDPGVIALQKTSRRMGDMSLLLVGIHSPNPDANIRYAELLTEKLRALPRDVATIATYNVRDLREFFKANKWLYVSEPDLESIRDRLRREIGRRKNPLFVDLGGDDEESIDSMRQRIAGGDNDRLGSRFPDGLFATEDKHYLWIATLPPGGLFVEHAGDSLWAAVNRLVAENPPGGFDPHMTVQLGGPVATAIASRQAIERDIVGVTVTCLVIVALSIALYFRKVRALPLIGAPALLGTVSAFAVAELAFGYLTSSTAFLGSIIIGNGINYAIVLLSRYEEDRERGRPSAEAMRMAIRDTWKATGVASLAASAAYASLMVTSFRGFYQFGLMASAGALMCWCATFTVLPAMVAILDGRAGAPRLGRPPFRLDRLSRFASRHYRPMVVVLGSLTVVAAFGGRHFLQDPFEYDFRKLNARIESTAEAQEFGQKVDQIFGRWPSPTIILADSPSEVEDIRATIRRQDLARSKLDPQHREVIGQITTVWDLLPGAPDVQASKLKAIGQIRKLVADPALETLDADERAKLAQIDPPANLRVLEPTDLPAIARRPFTEVDGSVGKVVLVYPIEHGISVWSGKDLLQMASVLQELHLPNGTVLETSGSAVVFGAMIRSVLRDGPIATGASLLAVMIIVLLAIRPLRVGLMALGTLLTGVLWMVGSAGWASVRVTFLNFIALPITFGIGAEYALNVVSRYRQDHDITRAINSTGAAVALCSWTTIVGYGSLLAARNQALRGFGLMAILGEVSCLTAAIIALPAALLWWAARGKA